jgi:Pyridoxamine 5'-phosphate oxidase
MSYPASVTANDPLAAVRPVLEAASPAVLTLYRQDGTVHVSPVWFRLHGDAIEVVIANGDRKLGYLKHDPRCHIVIFETTPPFRGLELRVDGILSPDGVAESRRAIATRYLGEEDGGRFADARGDRGFVLRLPVATARTWGLAAILPD